MKIKKLLSVLMLLVMIGMTINLSSCSKDDEYDIVGTWKATQDSLPDEYALFLFSSNGEGKATLYSQGKAEEEALFKYNFSKTTLNHSGEVVVLNLNWLSPTKFIGSSSDGENMTFTKQ
ncbi:MAG: hypothetical protein KBS73_02195 [Bacteroidales bacterium]|nr:hypothetical protein [Candidatus Cacconaster equifaecalis]